MMRLVAADLDETTKDGLGVNEGELPIGDREKSKSGKVGRGLVYLSVIPLLGLEDWPKTSEVVHRERAADGSGEGVTFLRLLLELLDS